jgi:hypothetical protein
MFHFFIHFYYFHLRMFERFMKYYVSFHMVCLLRYTSPLCINPGVHRGIIPHTILGVHPRRTSPACVRPVIHPAPNPFYIFGPILPSVISYLRSYLTADYRTSPVPAMFHFYSLFITFYFIPYLDVREIYKLHCVFIHTVCL